MGRLIKPAEYAKESGISRQAVYAKIKKGLLRAKKIDGQMFIELDSSVDISSKEQNSKVASKDLIEAKDETIRVLKETIADLKSTNNLIVGTLKSEVELLKEAFNEMQLLYRTQIEHLQLNAPKELPSAKDANVIEQNDFVDLKELSKSLGLTKEERKKFKKVAKTLVKQGDFRFVVVENDIFALKNANYSDFTEAINQLNSHTN
jgi:polyhydroxyalkanoate synthesis regulator phasin